MIEPAQVVKISVPAIQVEKDVFGTVHIKLRHEDAPDAFDFIQIQYDPRYTDNSHQHHLTQKIVEMLGGTYDPDDEMGKG